MVRLARTCLQRPAATAIVVGATTLFFAAGLLRLETDVGFRAFLGAQHPVVQRLDAFLARFGGGLPVLAVFACGAPAPCETVFDPRALAMADSVGRALYGLHGVTRVESPAWSPILRASSDGIEMRRLVEDGALVPDHAELAARAAQDPLWVGALVSRDARVGALLFEIASSDSQTGVRVVLALRAALAPFEAQGFRFHLVGGPVDYVVAGGELERGMRQLVPVVTALLAGVVWLLVRSALAVAATLAAMGVAVIWTLGAQGWLGWPQSTLTQLLPPLVLVMGTTEGIHVLARYGAEAAEAPADTFRERALLLERVAADIGRAAIATSVTTAAGFASFALSGLESFVRFGIVAAFGVMASFLLVYTLLPVLLALLPRERAPKVRPTEAWVRALVRLVDWVARRRRWIAASALAAGVVCAAAALRIDTFVRFEDLYGAESEVVRAVRFTETHLRRPETLEVEITLPEGQRAESPEVLRELAELAAFLEGVHGLGRVHSLLEPLARLHRLVQDDDPAFERPADTARGNAQLLALAELGDRGRLDPWLTPDHRGIRLSAEASKVSQPELRALLASVEAYALRELPGDWSVSLNGAAAVVHRMIEEVRWTQLSSFGASFVIVFGLVAWLLRSLRYALLAMIPTTLPIALTLGAMSLLGIALDVGTAMVAAVLEGLTVDQPIHLLHQYRRRRARGLSPHSALAESLPHIGRGVVVTSVALSLAFLSLAVSPWQSIASFGVVAAIAIAVALVTSLVVLPALLLLRVGAVALVIALGATPAHAEEPAAARPGEDVVPVSPRDLLHTALENRYDLDALAELEITVMTKGGATERRRARIASKRVGGRVLSFGRFTEPGDMRDMAVLRLEQLDRDDDFFAWLPEFRRVRRMSAAQKTDLFLGTDATFEDLERRHADEYDLELGPSEAVGGEPVWTLVARPKYASGYERVEYRIAKSDSAILEMRVWKQGSDTPAKRIETPRATTEAIGGHVLPLRILVTDEQRGTRTEVRIAKIRVNPKLDDRLFTEKSLATERPLPDF